MLKTQSQFTDLASTLASDGMPNDLLNWMTRLKLLIGVPFHYLVPSEEFLPPESIRFFYLDPNWTNALADGALSIGRHYNGDDTAPPTQHAEMATGAMANDTTTMNQVNFRRTQLKQPALEAGLNALNTVRTGFLLNSEVVKGWKTIDVAGYPKGASPYDYESGTIASSDVAPLTILRLVRLSDKVMLGIFEGDLYELVLHQPPEAIHFGFEQVFTTSQGNKVSKTLRVPTINWDDPDTQYDADSHQDVEIDTVFADQDARVLDMMALSRGLGAALHTAGDQSNPDIAAPSYYQAHPSDDNYKNHLLASDFALEMVHGVGLVSFINSNDSQESEK